MTIDPNAEVKQLRSQPKSVRFCPSCGHRRIRPVALKFGCRVCLFSFYILPGEGTDVSPVEKGQGGHVVEISSKIKVPHGTHGLAELLEESKESSNRFSSLATEKES